MKLFKSLFRLLRPVQPMEWSRERVDDVPPACVPAGDSVDAVDAFDAGETVHIPAVISSFEITSDEQQAMEMVERYLAGRSPVFPLYPPLLDKREDG